MNEDRYSLCLSYPKQFSQDSFSCFRIADYNIKEKRFEQAIYDSETEPRSIGYRPGDFIPFKPEIKRWKKDTFEDKLFSYSHYLSAEESIYELVFPSEFKNNVYDEGFIRMVLHSGFTIDENASDDLLIVVYSDAHSYFVLHCKSNFFKNNNGTFYVHQNISDMLHTVHHVNLYEIDKYHIICSEDANIKNSNNEIIKRYFYDSTVLPNSFKKFNLYGIEEYIPQYIINYLRKQKNLLQITNSNIHAISQVISEGLKDEKNISSFFGDTQYTTEELLEVIPQTSSKIVDILSDNSELNDVILNILLNSRETFNKCIDLVKKEWLKEHDAERETLSKKISIEKKKIEKANKQKALVDIEINDKKLELIAIESAIKENEMKLSQISMQISDELYDFSNNIVKQCELLTIGKSSFTSGNTISVSSNDEVVKVLDTEEIDDIDDFEEILQKNIEKIGYSKSALELSQVITFCISNNLPIIVSNNSINLARAIAATFEGNALTTISIPAGYTDYSVLVERIINGSKVCFISGLFDGCNDSLFNYLFNNKNIKNKIIILSADGVSAKYISKYIWNNAMFLDGDLYYSYPLENSFVSTSGEIDFGIEYKTDELKKQLKWLSKFTTKKIISNLGAYKLAKYMIDIDFDPNKDIMVWMQLVVNVTTTKSDYLIDEINSSNLKDDYKELLISYIEE